MAREQRQGNRRPGPAHEPVPARGPELPEDRMLVSFDIDCGYLLAGHRFIARGIADDGLITGESEEPYPGFSFEYELAPGVESGE